MDVERILERIGYVDSTELHIDTVGALQRQFMHRVPFENLDIHLGRTIHLDAKPVFAKIVTEQRGGFCFEVNEVLFRLLEGLGFLVTRAASTVLKNGGDAGVPHPFDHETVIVTIDGEPWLTDVGFGHSPFAPLRLHDEQPRQDEAGTFRLQSDHGHYRLEWERQPGQWIALHRVDPTPRRWEEFAERSAYLQTANDSNFTFKRLCTLPTEHGRVTLSGNHLTLNGQNEETVEETDYQRILNQQFGIVIEAANWVNPRTSPSKENG